MNDQYWGWILSVLGLVGFYVTGKKIWWGWWVNVGGQVVWYAYSIITQQWGFLVMTTMYTIIFTKNAIEWTKEHRAPQVIEGWDDNAVSYMQEDVELTKELYRKANPEMPKPELKHEFVVDTLGYESHEEMQARIDSEIEEWLSGLPRDITRGHVVTYMEENFYRPNLITIKAEVRK